MKEKIPLENFYLFVYELGCVRKVFQVLQWFLSISHDIYIYTLAAELLGLPLIPAYSEASGEQMLHGVNYASAAAGILDITGRNFVCTMHACFSFSFAYIVLICTLLDIDYILNFRKQYFHD